MDQFGQSSIGSPAGVTHPAPSQSAAPAAPNAAPSGGGASAPSVGSGAGTGGYFPQQQQAPQQQWQQPQQGQQFPQQQPAGFQQGASLRDNLNNAFAAAGGQAPQQGVLPAGQGVPQPGQQQQFPGYMPAGQQPQVPQSPQQQYAELQQRFADLERQHKEAAAWSAFGQHQWYQQKLRQQQGQPAAAPGQPAPGQPAAPKTVFGIPQFDEGLLKFATRDPQTGEIQFGPGAPPTAMYEYRQWQDARQKALEGFLSDPEKYIAPMIEERVKQMAPQLAQQQMQQQQLSGFVNNYVQENADWLYNMDQQGRIAVNPITGERQLSQLGQLYYQQVGQLQQMGVTDPRHQAQLAQQAVWTQVMMAQQRQAQAAAAQQQSQQGRANLLGQPAGFPTGPVTLPAAPAPQWQYPPGGQQQQPAMGAQTPGSAAVPQQPMIPSGLNHRTNLRGAMMNMAAANGMIQQGMPGGGPFG